MNSAAKNIASTPRLGIIALIAAALTIIACSTRSNSAAPAPAPGAQKLRPAAMRTAEVVATPLAVAASPSVAKPSAYKQMTFRSRDYGLSFTYPWQYAYLSARAIADQDPVLHSKTDGTDGPFTLVRIEIPKGYYPDTNFDTGYFSVGINQQLESDACIASAGAQAQTDTIGGTEFHWTESDVVGGGHSLKTRRYVAYGNGTCYQFELGLTTSNEDGLAREVDPDKVFGRLDSILRTVNIAGETVQPRQAVQTSAVAPPELPQ